MKWSFRLGMLSLLVQSVLLSAAVQQLQSLTEFAYLQGTAIVVAHDGQEGAWLNDFKNLSSEPAYMSADIQFKTLLLRGKGLTQFSDQYDLSEFPAYVILKDGQVIARNAGAYSLQDLAEFIDSHLGDDIRKALKEKREQQPVGARYSQSDVSSLQPDTDENDNDDYLENEDITAPDNGRIVDDRGYTTTTRIGDSHGGGGGDHVCIDHGVDTAVGAILTDIMATVVAMAVMGIEDFQAEGHTVMATDMVDAEVSAMHEYVQ